MKLIILSLLFSFLAFVGLGQEQFSYSFKGASDSVSLVAIAQEMERLEGVTSVKFRYKDAKKAGEFMIFSDRGTKNNPFPFQPADVKKLLINKGFEPLDLRKIN